MPKDIDAKGALVQFEERNKHKRSTGPGALADMDATSQEGDGGVTIQLLNTLDIQMTFRDLNFSVGIDPQLALDIAQRLIQVANVALTMKFQDGYAATPVAPTPKIDIVRGTLPKLPPRG